MERDSPVTCFGSLKSIGNYVSFHFMDGKFDLILINDRENSSIISNINDDETEYKISMLFL